MGRLLTILNQMGPVKTLRKSPKSGDRALDPGPAAPDITVTELPAEGWAGE